MTTQTTQQINGVNLEQLGATVEAVRQKPALARFQFRAHNEWVGGGHSRTSIQGFYGAGAEDTSRSRPFILEGDEPPVLLGENAGPNAVEAVLHALASCIAVSFIYHAAARGIRVDSLSMDLEGDLDLNGFLGLTDVRPGYQGVRLSYQVTSDAPQEKIEELCEFVQKISPVLDILRSPVPVSISLDEAVTS